MPLLEDDAMMCDTSVFHAKSVISVVPSPLPPTSLPPPPDGDDTVGDVGDSKDVISISPLLLPVANRCSDDTCGLKDSDVMAPDLDLSIVDRIDGDDVVVSVE
mmetsp:Transcript_20917/g.23739  ORF Transcript_20917/g.23739 Transcript_20917/m.23739 type:complete len:103 (-) Transcript_20917:391-699(-)